MRALTVALLFSITLNAFGQVNPNYDPDYDLDGNITVNDLLGFLSNFGVTWNSDNIIMGCTYSNYYEYNPEANYDDGSCATLLLLNLIGCEDDNAVYYHGHLYEIIKIGNQCWFKENLQSPYYRNGDIINSLLTDEEWINTLKSAITIRNCTEDLMSEIVEHIPFGALSMICIIYIPCVLDIWYAGVYIYI